MFGVFAELKLSSDQSFTITSIDYHAGIGGIYSGTFTWNDQLLKLHYADSRQKQFFLDSAKLYQIEELDTLVQKKKRYKEEYQIYKLSIKPELTTFSQPARTNLEQWSSGRIKNFQKHVQGFKNNTYNHFEKK